MDSRFYIVMSEADAKSQFANRRNAEIEAKARTIKDPSQKHYVLESVCFAEAAPPVIVTAMGVGLDNSI